MSPDEDADLARAIELSLRESSSSKVINVDSEDEDSDNEEKRFQRELNRALEASKAVSPRLPASRTQQNRVSEPPIPEPQSNGSNAASAFLSERAQLEKERRERQKRLRPAASLDNEDEGSEDDAQPPAKSATLPHTTTTLPTIDQMFWEGELRQIANKHADPIKDTRPKFRLSEMLGNKSDLSFAILSSFVASLPWIYEFFDPSVPVIIVGQPDESGQTSIHNVLPNWIRTTAFLRNGYGCMHMKFMLLFYKTGRLRVVISTANLVDYDYRDIENSAWVQDIPSRTSPGPHEPKADDFPALFQRVLRAINVRPALITLLKTDHPNIPLKSIDDLRTRWDWSKVKVHLVASIAGKHEGWPNVILTGHPRLMKAVRHIGMRTGKGKVAKELTLECQGSSIGSYSTQWMNEFHWSARGESAEDWLDQPKKRRESLPYPPVKILFPTLTTVRESVLGEPGGGTMFCARKQWAAEKFPRQLFHDSKSKAGRVLMHSKMIIGLLRDRAAPSSKGKRRQTPDSNSDTEDDDDEIQVIEPGIGWAYVGSHNFTPSAWGTLSGSSFNPVLNIRNYELGIVFPLKDEQAVNKVACWERPPKKYVLGQDKPWGL